MVDMIKRLLLLKIRKKRRYRVTKGLYVVPGRNQVVDISLSGLSFYYSCERVPPLRERYNLALLAENQAQPLRLPCRVVSDCETGELISQNQKIRRRSVRFEGLSAAQKTALKTLIMKCK